MIIILTLAGILFIISVWLLVLNVLVAFRTKRFVLLIISCLPLLLVIFYINKYIGGQLEDQAGAIGGLWLSMLIMIGAETSVYFLTPKEERQKHLQHYRKHVRINTSNIKKVGRKK